jgi:hypothetical protein
VTRKHGTSVLGTVTEAGPARACVRSLRRVGLHLKRGAPFFGPGLADPPFGIRPPRRSLLRCWAYEEAFSRFRWQGGPRGEARAEIQEAHLP